MALDKSIRKGHYFKVVETNGERLSKIMKGLTRLAGSDYHHRHPTIVLHVSSLVRIYSLFLAGNQQLFVQSRHYYQRPFLLFLLSIQVNNSLECEWPSTIRLSNLNQNTIYVNLKCTTRQQYVYDTIEVLPAIHTKHPNKQCDTESSPSQRLSTVTNYTSSIWEGKYLKLTF